MENVYQNLLKNYSKDFEINKNINFIYKKILEKSFGENYNFLFLSQKRNGEFGLITFPMDHITNMTNNSLNFTCIEDNDFSEYYSLEELIKENNLERIFIKSSLLNALHFFHDLNSELIKNLKEENNNLKNIEENISKINSDENDLLKCLSVINNLFKNERDSYYLNILNNYGLLIKEDKYIYEYKNLLYKNKANNIFKKKIYSNEEFSIKNQIDFLNKMNQKILKSLMIFKDENELLDLEIKYKTIIETNKIDKTKPLTLTVVDFDYLFNIDIFNKIKHIEDIISGHKVQEIKLQQKLDYDHFHSKLDYFFAVKDYDFYYEYKNNFNTAFKGLTYLKNDNYEINDRLSYQRVHFVLKQDDEIIGFLSINKYKDNEIFKIGTIAISDAYKGNGFTDLLYENCVNILSQLNYYLIRQHRDFSEQGGKVLKNKFKKLEKKYSNIFEYENTDFDLDFLNKKKFSDKELEKYLVFKSFYQQKDLENLRPSNVHKKMIDFNVEISKLKQEKLNIKNTI